MKSAVTDGEGTPIGKKPPTPTAATRRALPVTRFSKYLVTGDQHVVVSNLVVQLVKLLDDASTSVMLQSGQIAEIMSRSSEISSPQPVLPLG